MQRKAGSTKQNHKRNKDILNKLKIKPVIRVYSQLSEEMEGTHEQNEYRKNPNTNSSCHSGDSKGKAKIFHKTAIN